MITLVISWLAAMTVCVVVIARRPAPRLIAFDAQRSGPRLSAVDKLGWLIRSLFRQQADPTHDRVVGRGVVLAVCLSAVNIWLAIMVAFSMWVRSVARRRRRTQDVHERVEAALADLIDLFAVALFSGNTVGQAVRQAGTWSDDHIASAFAWCDRQVQSGRSLSDALEELPSQLGPQVRSLTAALVATERYGAPITVSLAQLAVDTRADRRRRAEAAARRLPVLLLFPLVVCVLPAFMLITVVPVIFETFASFDSSASP